MGKSIYPPKLSFRYSSFEKLTIKNFILSTERPFESRFIVKADNFFNITAVARALCCLNCYFYILLRRFLLENGSAMKFQTVLHRIRKNKKSFEGFAISDLR